LREILLTGKIVPWRARLLYDSVGKSTDQPEYLKVLAEKEGTRQLILKVMADNRLDALVYATFDHQPTLIAPDVLTNPDTKDEAGRGNNRYLSPAIAFPAPTVPAGFTTDGLPVGIEFMGRPFAEPTLLKLGYAYEQSTRNRKPPASTPALPGEL
jgi:amidase